MIVLLAHSFKYIESYIHYFWSDSVTWKDCKGLSGAELSSEWYEGITPDDLQKLFGDCRISLRVIKGTQYENDAGKQEYYADSQELLQHLIDGTPGQMKE